MRGEVTVEVRTDSPERRFVPGASLATEPSKFGPLVISSARNHSGTLLLTFVGVDDRNAAEALRNTLLLADVDPRESNINPDEFHISQIVGCIALSSDGEEIGTVVDVLSLPAQDTLVIERSGREILVPFVKAHVPEVDIVAKRIIINSLEGLL